MTFLTDRRLWVGLESSRLATLRRILPVFTPMAISLLLAPPGVAANSRCQTAPDPGKDLERNSRQVVPNLFSLASLLVLTGILNDNFL